MKFEYFYEKANEIFKLNNLSDDVKLFIEELLREIHRQDSISIQRIKSR